MRRCLYIFSHDLRLDDNPALVHALSADEVGCLYYRDLSSPWCIEGASAWWLGENLKSLSESLQKNDIQLSLLSGNSIQDLLTFISTHKFNEVCIARSYSKYERESQKQLHEWCSSRDIELKRFPGIILFEPESVANQQGSFYRVFTPFHKYCNQKTPRTPLDFSIALNPKPLPLPSEDLEQWDLCPHSPNWATPIANNWEAGEDAAHATLNTSINEIIENYENTRNDLSSPATSLLSPYLALGVVSPARIWQEVSTLIDSESSKPWLRQLHWREFNYHLLFHNEDMDHQEFSPKFSSFPWMLDETKLQAWQKGQTGYPVVDAAMQELWQTGWMHNRARMITASFLTKHLQQHWLSGARWFWNTLIDADLANNTNGWQWTAGSGADASPYFRIFNPITQGQKFDATGDYVRRWLPQLKDLPNKYLHCPWEAPIHTLNEADVRLGDNYPHPIVDHKQARLAALEAYKNISS